MSKLPLDQVLEHLSGAAAGGGRTFGSASGPATTDTSLASNFPAHPSRPKAAATGARVKTAFAEAGNTDTVPERPASVQRHLALPACR